jgi:hypothetical protein
MRVLISNTVPQDVQTRMTGDAASVSDVAWTSKRSSRPLGSLSALRKPTSRRVTTAAHNPLPERRGRTPDRTHAQAFKLETVGRTEFSAESCPAFRAAIAAEMKEPRQQNSCGGGSLISQTPSSMDFLHPGAPFFVVVAAPEGDLPSGVKQVLKPAHAQTLFAQSSMETLHVRILRGLAGLDTHQLDLPFDPSSQEITTGQFRAVVALNRLPLSALLDDLLQHARHLRLTKLVSIFSARRCLV